MGAFLEIVKYTLPSIVVFATAYYILKRFLDHQTLQKQLEMSKELSATRLPLKLQAYERLLLFCERIKISSLIMRLRTPNMTAKELKLALLVSVQKEYEHNLAQQLYTSKNLWNIVSLSKDEVLNLITLASASITDSDVSDVLVSRLQAIVQDLESNPVDVAINAIKEEAKMILG